uniref:Phospholipase A2, membrane associated n=5 Tax=Mus musculus TaxID=10090 RepID=PA2GA_MOUSE|nr:phospholipase A2, membrane associated precursor [Mus musculus]P31482.3 RecName: Full=Phospholipase A2, membrane associated; AltName: Full=Enhancing factor; Short=EF; AltName: Full=GIIC sPLA2; AltName: Full=Group IIA phospholipase A2; AltName: Full=Phosphatidylcholine 2-acylhydrolase 2A; Flags: Precursor [Mus musculus]AAC52252.1 secretory group II phospholipase A2 [Mus musculus]AAH45156.1 Pla2g2a protein [Mus musculus]AHB62392.1 phospholipase A2 group IIa [Mus musculus]
MKVLLLLAASIMAFGSIQVQGNIAQFGEMIRLKTGKRAELSYAFYGCHCGLGGKGSPKDATDRCCVTHDCCYKSLEKSGCGTKLLKYKYSHQGGQITCSANQNSCQKRLCQCDKAAAECFARNKKTYSLKYQFYPNMFCKGKKPKC